MAMSLNSKVSLFLYATVKHPANKGYDRITAIPRALMWRVYKIATQRRLPWTVRIYGGMRMYCYPDSDIAQWIIYTRGRPDWHEMAFVKRYLRPGDKFIDVGANIGLYTVLAASIIEPAGEIEAFEPDPETAKRLQENLVLNGIDFARVHKVAAGDQTREMHWSRDHHDGLRRLLPPTEEKASSFAVSCIRLEEELANKSYAMGKMDIEGAELNALRGAESMIANHNPPVWLLEVNERMLDYGISRCMFYEWMTSRGYEFADYDADRQQLKWLSTQRFLSHDKLRITLQSRKCTGLKFWKE